MLGDEGLLILDTSQLSYQEAQPLTLELLGDILHRRIIIRYDEDGLPCYEKVRDYIEDRLRLPCTWRPLDDTYLMGQRMLHSLLLTSIAPEGIVDLAGLSIDPKLGSVTEILG